MSSIPSGGTPYSGFQLLLATIQQETPFGDFEHVIKDRDFPFLRSLWPKKMTYEGTFLEHDVVLSQDQTGRYVQLAEDCPPANQEHMTKVRTRGSILNHNMWFEERELKANRTKGGARKIQDLYKARRAQKPDPAVGRGYGGGCHGSPHQLGRRQDPVRHSDVGCA